MTTLHISISETRSPNVQIDNLSREDATETEREFADVLEEAIIELLRDGIGLKLIERIRRNQNG